MASSPRNTLSTLPSLKFSRFGTKPTRMVNRRYPMRFARKIILHDVNDLRKFEHGSVTMPVVLDKGAVISGIGWAQVASVIPWGRRLETIQLTHMNADNIRAYCSEIKRIARKDRWTLQMRCIELQHFENALSAKKH